MTFIEPNKNKFNISILTFLTVILILTGALLSIFAYNQNVRLNHFLNSYQKEVEGLQVANANLKNQLYGILDLKNAEELARDLGLVKEKRPEYLAQR